MDGSYKDGMYTHPSLGLIKIFIDDGEWVYQCYTSNGAKPVSNPKPLDQWTWAMSEER